MSSPDDTREFVSLGMFIIDEFTFVDDKGEPTGQTLPPQVRALSICSIRIYNSKLPCDDQIGGGGTYAAIGARIWCRTAQTRPNQR